MFLRGAFERLKRAQRPLIRVVQRGILAGSLFLLYWIGFGLSRLFMAAFARRTLHHRPRRGFPGGSRWREAEGYDLDPDRIFHQS